MYVAFRSKLYNRGWFQGIYYQVASRPDRKNPSTKPLLTHEESALVHGVRLSRMDVGNRHLKRPRITYIRSTTPSSLVRQLAREFEKKNH